MEQIELPYNEDIRRRRQAAGWSQQDLGERAGISQVYLSNLERGIYKPRLVTIERIYRAFGLEVKRFTLVVDQIK